MWINPNIRYLILFHLSIDCSYCITEIDFCLVLVRSSKERKKTIRFFYLSISQFLWLCSLDIGNGYLLFGIYAHCNVYEVYRKFIIASKIYSLHIILIELRNLVYCINCEVIWKISQNTHIPSDRDKWLDRQRWLTVLLKMLVKQLK